MPDKDQELADLRKFEEEIRGLLFPRITAPLNEVPKILKQALMDASLGHYRDRKSQRYI